MALCEEFETLMVLLEIVMSSKNLRGLEMEKKLINLSSKVKKKKIETKEL